MNTKHNVKTLSCFGTHRGVPSANASIIPKNIEFGLLFGELFSSCFDRPKIIQIEVKEFDFSRRLWGWGYCFELCNGFLCPLLYGMYKLKIEHINIHVQSQDGPWIAMPYKLWLQ